MLLILAASAAVAGFVCVCVYCMGDRDGETEPAGAQLDAYILENQVTHARLLPTPSAHAFSYPTLALFLSLDALEAHSLDLAHGWLFGYGGTSWRVAGLRSAAYLLPDPRRSIKEKLREVLGQYGHDARRLGEVWLLTMPSYMGYEGINPLTVHYCYEKVEGGGEREDRLAWVVLEIHNTFGEKHVHVLEPGVGEDEGRPSGYDHQWTFARDFHVSPFNDRLGHYRVSLSAPPPPSAPSLRASPPRPKIRIHLHAVPTPPDSDTVKESRQRPSESAVGPLKLTATLVARRAVPLTSRNLMRALARYPLALFLSFARILYHAWILHYTKRLDVFPRPDPKPAMRACADSDSDSDQDQGAGLSGSSGPEPEKVASRAHGGIGWQEEGPLEAYSRRAVERFLRRRAQELGLRVVLVSGDPSVPRQVFAPASLLELRQTSSAGGQYHDGRLADDELVVRYTAPRFFSTLALAPSAAHMLLLGRAEGLFRVDSDALFTRVFAAEAAPASFNAPLGRTVWTRWNQRVRTALLPEKFLRSAPLRDEGHPFDDDGGLGMLPVVCLLHFGDWLEKTVFAALKARFVPGLEPWGRALDLGSHMFCAADALTVFYMLLHCNVFVYKQPAFPLLRYGLRAPPRPAHAALPAPDLGELVAPARELAEERVLVGRAPDALLLALHLGDDVGEGMVEAGKGLVEDVGVPHHLGRAWLAVAAGAGDRVCWRGCLNPLVSLSMQDVPALGSLAMERVEDRTRAGRGTWRRLEGFEWADRPALELEDD
ncbi:hypothetical protein C8Q80DRAFT_1346406 [Daedaleopsis nitida]|nr:hypothetical protein C8Q80DRAFT_1346406 [Daedaleopsis nitida]